MAWVSYLGQYPLPAEVLQAQESRYQQKQKELQALRDPRGDPEGKEYVAGKNDHAQVSRWDMSASPMAKWVESDPNNLLFRYLHILKLLEAGNRAGVRLACEDLLKRFGNTNDPARVKSVAWYCVLAPEAVADQEALVRLAERVLALHPERGKERSDALKTLGAALYRAGQFEEAIRRLDESIQTRGAGGDPEGFAFLAHHRSGHRDQAERWLTKLVASQPRDGFEFSQDEVVIRMEIRILHREAESLILGSRASAPPNAPSAPTKQE